MILDATEFSLYYKTIAIFVNFFFSVSTQKISEDFACMPRGMHHYRLYNSIANSLEKYYSNYYISFEGCLCISLNTTPQSYPHLPKKESS